MPLEHLFFKHDVPFRLVEIDLAAAKDDELKALSKEMGLSLSLEEMERQHILQLLEECGGNRSRVARILGISRRTVHRKLRQYGIDSGD